MYIGEILHLYCFKLGGKYLTPLFFKSQTKVSSILYWGQENQQMLLMAGLCVLAAGILVAAVVVFLLRNRFIARQKLKDLTQSADTEATRDYQVRAQKI